MGREGERKTREGEGKTREGEEEEDREGERERERERERKGKERKGGSYLVGGFSPTLHRYTKCPLSCTHTRSFSIGSQSPMP